MVWSPTNSNVEMYSQAPPCVNADAPMPMMFGSSTSVSMGISQKPLDTTFTESRSYTRPGKEPAARFEANPLKLQELCRRHGGSTFALDWIVTVFKYGVTKEALIRTLSREEIDELSLPGASEPRQAYDGFLSKVGDRYECGLCKDGKKTHWKHKKDAPRHLRKFHFGLADLCRNWYVRSVIFNLSSNTLPFPHSQ